MIKFLQTKCTNVLVRDNGKYLTGPEAQEQSWQQKIVIFLEEQGGSYSDKKWQMDYFEEFKMIGLGDGVETKKKESFKALKRASNKDFTLKEIEKINATNRINQQN